MENKRKILAVDDTPAILTEIKTVLRKEYDVRLAKGAAMARKVLASTHIDLILLDIEMPVTDGFAFAQQLKWEGNFGDIPIIFCTSQSSVPFVKEAIKHGAKYFITKPIDHDVLKSRINDVLNAAFYVKLDDPIVKRKFIALCSACKNDDYAEVISHSNEVLRMKYDDKIQETVNKITGLAMSFRLEEAASAITNLIES